MTENQTHEPTPEQIEAAAVVLTYVTGAHQVGRFERTLARDALRAAAYASNGSSAVMPSACGAPGYRDGWRCQKPAGHPGNHGVLTPSGNDWYDWPR